MKRPVKADDLPPLLLRVAAAKNLLDMRTLMREVKAPGSVKGLAGDRARNAIADVLREMGETR